MPVASSSVRFSPRKKSSLVVKRLFAAQRRRRLHNNAQQLRPRLCRLEALSGLLKHLCYAYMLVGNPI